MPKTSRAAKRALRAMTDPVNFRSLVLTVLCFKGWAYAKFGRHIKSKEVVLELKQAKLCVDIARAEIISFWEIWQEKCYDAIAIDRPACVVDVGANIGAFSLYQSIQQHADRVIAFEPSPGVFRRLEKNVELNGLTGVRVVNAAVGDKPGVLAFTDGLMSLNGRVSESGPLQVPCVRLDDELKDIPSVDILKIDTEGYEIHVLKGASGTLRKTKSIALELHYPGEQEEVESVIGGFGFTLVKTHDDLVFYRKSTALNPD